MMPHSQGPVTAPLAVFTESIKEEEISMSTDRRMDKDVVYIYNGIFLSHQKKKKNNATYSNMGGPIDYYTK